MHKHGQNRTIGGDLDVIGAEDGIRTRDPLLAKEVGLSAVRASSGSAAACKHARWPTVDWWLEKVGPLLEFAA